MQLHPYVPGCIVVNWTCLNIANQYGFLVRESVATKHGRVEQKD